MFDEDAEMPEGFPEAAWHGIWRYLVHGISPGEGLLAVLRGDLFEVFRRCDEATLSGLGAMVRYLSRCCPPESHGSAERVQYWLDHGGLRGIRDRH